MKKTSRSQTNFIIDIIMMIFMMLTAGIGFFIKYVLIPGFKRNLKYGRDVELTFWGLDRHQWGTVHLIVSLILVGLVLLHIILHWRQIKCLYRNLVDNKMKRIMYAIVLVIVCCAFAVGPLFIKPTVVASRGHLSGHSHRADEGVSTRNEPVVHEHEPAHAGHNSSENRSLSEEIPVYGYMTTADIARHYNVSATGLAQHLGISSAETEVRLGQLRRTYNFRMSDVRAYIEEQRKKKE